MRYIAVDLHTNSLTVCFLEAGKQEHFATYGIEALDTFRAELKPDDVLAA
jgi:transposase